MSGKSNRRMDNDIGEGRAAPASWSPKMTFCGYVVLRIDVSVILWYKVLIDYEERFLHPGGRHLWTPVAPLAFFFAVHSPPAPNF
jgi:hypothetical protein